MTQIDWMEFLRQVLDIFVIPMMLILTAYLIVVIRKKKQELEEKIEDEKYHKYLDLLESTIIDCVIATNQTFVEALKKDNAFTEEAQKEAFNRTYNAVMTILSNDAKIYLETALGDLQAYITSKIESGVVTVKLYK
jgi:hypothetical protein